VSEFTLRFPLLLPGEAAAPAASPELGDERAAQFRILVVDDTAPVAEMFARLLESLGHEAQTADNGAAALEQTALFDPQIVFSDISMPEMSGYELAQRLRALPGGRDLVLVAMTGYGQPQDRERALQAGFDYHLVKPAETAALGQLFQVIARERLRQPLTL
jgi:CheY-like chemotaxis protein